MKTYTREDVISLLLVVSALSKSIATKMQMMEGGDNDGKDELTGDASKRDPGDGRKAGPDI